MLDLCVKEYPNKIAEILLTRDQQNNNLFYYFGSSIDNICRYKLPECCLVMAKKTFLTLTTEYKKTLKKVEIKSEKKEEEEVEGETEDLDIAKKDFDGFIWAMIRRAKTFKLDESKKFTTLCDIFKEIREIESSGEKTIIDLTSIKVEENNIPKNLSIAAAENRLNYDKIEEIFKKYSFLARLKDSFLKNTCDQAFKNFETEATKRPCFLDRLEELAKIIRDVGIKKSNVVRYKGKTATTKTLVESFGEDHVLYKKVVKILKSSKSLALIYESYLTSYIEYAENKIKGCTKKNPQTTLLCTLLETLKFVAEHGSDDDRSKICNLLLKKWQYEVEESRWAHYKDGSSKKIWETKTYTGIFRRKFNYSQTNPAYLDLLATLIKRGKIEKVKAILIKDKSFPQKYKSTLDKISLELINNNHSISAISLMIDCKWPKTNLKNAIIMAIKCYITNPHPIEKIQKLVIKVFSANPKVVNETLKKGDYSLKQLQLFRERLTASRSEHSSRIPGARNPVSGLEKIVDSFIGIKIQEEKKKQKELKKKEEEEIEENSEKQNTKQQKIKSSGSSIFSSIFSSGSTSGKKQKTKKQGDEKEIELVDKNENDEDSNNTII